MRRLLHGGVMVFALGLTAAAAQNPTTPPPPRNPASPDPAYTRTQAQFVTVEGCVMREADVSGRERTVAGQAGIDEDYILTSTKMIKGAAPASAAEARPAATPTGTSGTGAMYEIKGIDDKQLKQHVGRRVQIEGTFENIERAQTSPDEKTPADHLAEIRGTSIRQVAGDCPAK